MNLSPAYLEWEEKTLNQGKQEGIQQVALNLLSLGTDPVLVSQATGLSLEQVLSWQRQD